MVHGVPRPPPPPARRSAEADDAQLGTVPKAGSSHGWDADRLHAGRLARVEKAEEEKVESSDDEEVKIGVGIALPMTPPEIIEAEPPQVAARPPPDYCEPQLVNTERAEAMIAAHKQVHKEVSGDRIQRGGWQIKAQVLVDLVANGFTDDAMILASHYGPRLDREQVAEVLRRC